jgi:hypothetical protein
MGELELKIKELESLQEKRTGISTIPIALFDFSK